MGGANVGFRYAFRAGLDNATNPNAVAFGGRMRAADLQSQYLLYGYRNDTGASVAYVKGNGDAYFAGNLVVSGTKSFIQDDPVDATKSIVYVALEGGEAGTYWRGTARLHQGRARVALPAHFALVTDDDGLTAQVTPGNACRGWMTVVKKTASTLDIQERGAKDDCAVDYLVQGIRKGHEHFKVLQPKPIANAHP